MTPTDPPPLGAHLLDTGPMLCLGGSTVLADLYEKSHLIDGAIVAAVRDELRRHAADERPHKRVQRRSASFANKRFYPLLRDAVAPPTPTPTLMNALATEMHDREKAKEEQHDRVYHHNALKHLGEVESIYAASQAGSTFVTSDIPAGAAARSRGVAVDTFVDLAVHLLRAQRLVKAKKVASELQGLQRSGLDIGGTVNGQLDLTTRYRHR